MTVHAVAAISPGKIIARETSCHCKECFRNGIYNPESPCGWKVHLLKECSNTVVKPVAEDWVAAVYDRKWYVGKVLEADPIDNDAFITMQSTTKQVGFLKWPVPADQVWVDFGSILAIIEPPFPSGKTQRQYKLRLLPWSRACLPNIKLIRNWTRAEDHHSSLSNFRYHFCYLVNKHSKFYVDC